jgi:exo-1,4-beta-D-glucosaminidase
MKLRAVTAVLSLAGLAALSLSGTPALARASTASTASTARAASAAARSAATRPHAARPVTAGSAGLTTLGGSWQVQSSAASTGWTTGTGATQDGAQISAPGFAADGWLPVTADDAGGAGTEVEALLQNGVCPLDTALQPVNQSAAGTSSVFYSDNMAQCFGPPQTREGADANPLFSVPWWFRTSFTGNLHPGQDAKLVINGVVGQADVWVNGTEVATQATVEGDYTTYSFDVTGLIRPGANALALELFPNNPSSMFTLDDVDWSQIPPDNNTGIQFPVQLHIAAALGLRNVHVTQNDATDMSSAALTVQGDVTNNTSAPRAGVVSAAITPPGGGAPVVVSRPVTLAGGQSSTVTFTPSSFPQLVLHHPQLWWPYQMGGQPLYQLSASVSAGGAVSDSVAPETFGIRSVTTYLTAPSDEAADGVRVFEINGVPFDYRAGGWSENLFLHYSASDLASQITLIKSMGINGIRTEGKEMPADFYEQMDKAGILLDAGFQCCDKWAPSSSGRGVTAQEFHVMYQSSLTIGERLRDHPSVINYSWSDNPPIKEQEAASTAGFSQAGFQDPIISSAEYNVSAQLGPSGEKEGPYDWVPPSYYFDTTHSSNNGNDNDSSQTNVGGSFGFDSEQGSGDTVPTMDSIQRFLSPADQSALWQQPDAHQYHLNYESTDGEHSGYSFGTLDNLDTAVAARYGQWTSLPQYVQEAQVQNYENTRAQFEAYIDHWDNYPTPSTGTDYWQLNKGWPTMLWDLYNYDYDTAGAYFGAKKANEELHVLYALDTGDVTVDNLSGAAQRGLSVQARVYNTSGHVLDSQTANGLSLAPQAVSNGVLTPKVPAATTPPAPATTYFVELTVSQHGSVVDRNVYWLSTQQDVIDWDSTEGNPQANNGDPLSQYADLTALQKLPSEPVQVAAATQPASGGRVTTTVTITNPSASPAVAFFLRADVRRGSASGSVSSGDNQVLPITWSDNDITLWPGQSQTLTATYRSALLNGATPVASVEGWNVPGSDSAAPQTRAAQAAETAAENARGVTHFGAANGAVSASASPGDGADPQAFATTRTSGGSKHGPAWTVSSVANSPTASPSTSFTQGDTADTYTITVKNTGSSATDGSTPVTLTDVVDPDMSMVSMTGSGWTCDTDNDPTEVCTEAGGSGGGPAVLQPGQSYPPITLTVSVPHTAGYGTQDSTAGLHLTNDVTVAGGGAGQTSAASETPVAGRPDLTADNAVASAFRQGDASDQYQITVINTGGGPTTGDASAPVTATITALPAGVTLQALYGSGWTCNTDAITSPVTEPASTCYRSDVLAGENGEEPPITAVVSVSSSAAASGSETVQVSGGGDAVAAASVSAATAIAPASPAAAPPASANPPVLTAASSHSGSFAQGDSADSYTLKVSSAASGGPTSGTVTVTDTLPAGLTPARMSGSGWDCALAPATPGGSPNLFEPAPTCTRSDTLAAGAAYPPITLTVATADNTQASVTSTVTVSGGGSANPASATDATTVRQLAALAVTGGYASGGLPYAPFAQGDGPSAADTYNLTIANDGFAATTGPVTVRVSLPAGLSAVSAPGAGWSCSAGSTVTCTSAGPLAAGQSRPLVLRVAVSRSAPQYVSTVVQADAGGAVPAAGLDTGNLNGVVLNGGAAVIPTYITAR